MADDDPEFTLAYLSALMRDLVTWADAELAAGAPPKFVAQQLVDSVRYMRTLITQAQG